MLASCDNRHETNGNLSGMWQMVEWYDQNSKSVIKTNEDKLYYCVQLELIKFMDAHNSTKYHLARFKHEKDSLIIGNIYYYPGDTLCSYSELEKFGVPTDGRFHIDVLNGEHLRLSCPERTLTFRKY